MCCGGSLTPLLAFFLLRLLKATLIALQYKHKAEQGRFGPRLRGACGSVCDRPGLLWPTLLGAAGLAVLIGLGTWQLERKQWKEALIAKIAARVDAEPMPLATVERRWRAGGDVDYLHVAAKGRFHHDKERYLYAPAPAGLGWHVYTPLEMRPARMVWVNRGLSPDARRPRPARAGPARRRGRGARLVRRAAAAGHSSRRPTMRRATSGTGRTCRAMTRLGLRPSARSQTLPVRLDRCRSPRRPPGGLPRGGVTRLDLPNRHLEYALTWYGLALTLIGCLLGLCHRLACAALRARRRLLAIMMPGCNGLRLSSSHVFGWPACLVRPPLAA